MQRLTASTALPLDFELQSTRSFNRKETTVLSEHCPEHFELARKNTPLQKMPRLSRELGVEIFFKRDDLTGSELSGNKIRKLEFLLADARAKGADTVITCGGAQSNHCRATAIAAVRCSMQATVLLRTEDPAQPPATTGNILLDKLVGAEIVWITPQEYQDIDRIFQRESDRLAGSGRIPCIIPEGGSNHIGCWGYITALREIREDLSREGITDPAGTTVLSATGSGGTTAGLVLGTKLLDLDVDVAGVNVCDDADYFKNKVSAICRDFSRSYGRDIPVCRDEIRIIDGYVGRGYARSRPEELRAIQALARLEGVILDPVYTGKAFYGLQCELKKDRNRFGTRIVFIHTGGIFGLFPCAAQFEELF
ncbi:MAG: D-cysteine desulfhydrase family protein [Desulfofustis sp.]|nr:D-cysteine desulfhydrase family protein [Desulfofustis sp.]